LIASSSRFLLEGARVSRGILRKSWLHGISKSPYSGEMYNNELSLSSKDLLAVCKHWKAIIVGFEVALSSGTQSRAFICDIRGTINPQYHIIANPTWLM
jgi:hypothetical protein